MENWLAGTEITTVEVPVTKPAADSEQNPWLATAGIFADDPALEPMLREIYAARAADVFRDEEWRNMATITEILDDLRAADEIIRHYERRYWLSSADFYDLYNQGLLDDGENLEDFTEWAAFYKLKLRREEALAQLSRQRAATLRHAERSGFVILRAPEPQLVAAR